MNLSNTIQKIAIGAMYDEKALNQAMKYKALSTSEKQAIKDKLSGQSDQNIAMRLQDVAIKTKLHNKSGSLTRYGLACGYMESKAALNSDDYVTLELDCIFHVKGYKKGLRIWESFDTLTAARKFYRSIRIR